VVLAPLHEVEEEIITETRTHEVIIAETLNVNPLWINARLILLTHIMTRGEHILLLYMIPDETIHQSQGILMIIDGTILETYLPLLIFPQHH
jgi:hypothetical protein